MSNRPSSSTPSFSSDRGNPGSGGSSSPVLWIVLGVLAVVVVVAGIAAVALSGGDDETVSAGGSGEVASGPVIEFSPSDPVIGDPLPPLTDPSNDTAVGLPAPELEGSSFDSSPVGVIFDGRPKIVSFLAHWCPHCQDEKPRLEEWLASGAKRDDVDVYVVATAQDRTRGNWPPSSWLSAFPAPVLMDDEDSSAAQAFGLTAFPYTVVIDAEGQVVQRFTGEAGTVFGMPSDEAFSMLADLAAGA